MFNRFLTNILVGSVIWVKLDEDVINSIAVADPSQIATQTPDAVDSYNGSHEPELVRMITVPYSPGGSSFLSASVFNWRSLID